MTSPGRAPVPFVPRSARKAALGGLLDRLLTRLAPHLVAGPRPLPRHPKVLVVRLDHLGDAVLATSVLGPLTESLAPERLDVLCGPWAAEVFRANPHVHDVLTADMPWWLAVRGASRGARVLAWLGLPRIVSAIRRRRYDVVIELRGDLRQILLFGALSGAPERVGTDRTGGAALLTRVWPFDGSVHEVEKAVGIVATLGVRRAGRPQVHVPDAIDASWRMHVPETAVVVAPWGSHPDKSLDARAAASLIAALRAAAVPVVLVGGRGEQRHARDLHHKLPSMDGITDLVGRTSVPELAWVLGRARAVVCVDSGPSHLAAAVGTPVVVLFGPTDPAQFRPWGANVTIVASEPPGAPASTIPDERVWRAVAETLGVHVPAPAYFPP